MLIEAGFVVQRYDAYSTNSIYLKLDYGLCNSIRISDHKGKKHLSYKYNLRCDIKKYHKERDKFTRYFYPFEQRKNLIEHIKYDRRQKIYQLGSIEEYRDIMNIEKNLNKNNKGFWQQAYLVR